MDGSYEEAVNAHYLSLKRHFLLLTLAVKLLAELEQWAILSFIINFILFQTFFFFFINPHKTMKLIFKVQSR